MNIGFLGLGKLGLPVAVTLAARGLTVYGVDPAVSQVVSQVDDSEELLDEMLAEAGERFHRCEISDLVTHCNVCFVAVQTPHEPRFEGTASLPEDRADFDYSYLIAAIGQLAQEAGRQQHPLTVAVISTVLPGTMEREISPLLSEYLTLVYNPSFIAMGTVVRDFLDPEFVLLGGDDEGAVEAVYREIDDTHQLWFVRTSIRNAELIKVAYNTFIGLKIAFANTLMEICQRTGCDVDEITGALSQADRRLISPAYLSGGMGDGGGCHPRDGIALSWLARELDLSYDLFGAVMECRENQAEWLCKLMREHDLPKAILGMEYKPGSELTTGSAAVLCANVLRDYGEEVTEIRRGEQLPEGAHVFLIGCMHPEYVWERFPAGSVVIDPHRYISDQEDVNVIRVGEAPGGRRRLLPPVGDPESLGQAAT